MRNLKRPSYHDLDSCLAVAYNGNAHSKDDLCIAVNRLRDEVIALKTECARTRGDKARLLEALHRATVDGALRYIAKLRQQSLVKALEARHG